ncbi:polysaccharide pyruvyl transferase family protein [Iamia majanohamensis]|uniref:Polysaccharide pyruvyl transferase family protein n=1 Tax=Iamia majanohamensis TaxID=467976 RepID=A0AAE9YCA6_9ACTN|nr:polysaccharide pyruvyl transferase family protein [Iamia majanohamensis]WCO68429.1 polysaccharide pyruvyl transferase family protein [Iamia majanohamensis]
MADDAAPDATPSTTERARAFLARARQAPNRIDEVASDVAVTQAALDDLGRTMERLEELVWAGRGDARAGVTAIGDELGLITLRIQDLAARVAEVDGAVAGHATALHRAVAAPARSDAAAALREALGPAPEPTTGLSVFTLCWNHGGLLEASVRSGLAALDRLPDEEQGQVLVLDDASSDATAEVAAALAAEDPRVRVVTAPVNLGLALARTTLLHAATTTHAFQLDADNTARPEGVEALYRAARATGAALTYGTVVQVDPSGAARGPVSNEPPSPPLFSANYVDTMAVVDVAALRALGGWSPDPLLEHVDDWANVHRVVEAGLLLTFVPTLVGRYLDLGTAFHHSVGDPRIGASRVARVFDPTGRRQGPGAMDDVAAVAWDPEAGSLWATPAAVALRPDLAPDPAPADPGPPPGPRILVLASGGVGNVGDDAITVRAVERLQARLGPDVALDLVTDGPQPPGGLGPVRWLGPLTELLPGLDHEQLGRLDAATAAAADRLRVGQGAWHALDPAAYDAALLLGGGSLVSEWSHGLVAPRALLAAALRRAAVPYALSGQGIGPLDDAADRSLVAGLLAGAVAVACRDADSATLARALPGVDPTRVVVTGDDALGLAPEGGDGPDRRPSLVVTVRSAPYVGGEEHHGAARAWARAADALAAERGWDVVGLALNRQDPEPEIATLADVRATTPLQARWHLVECSTDPRLLVAEVARAEAVAAQSFHAALLALAAGVPAVLAATTPYYRAKARGLAAQAGLPEALAVDDPADLPDSLAAITAALAPGPTPFADREAAVDAWWSDLPEALGLPRTAHRD